MPKTYLYIGLFVCTVALGGIAAWIATTPAHTSSVQTDTTSGFLGSLDAFAFLRNDANTNVSTTSASASEDATKIEAFIRAWNEARAVQSNTQYTILPSEEDAPETPATQESVEALLSNLLGKSTLSALKTTTGATFSSGTGDYTSDSNVLWDGSYTGNIAPISGVADAPTAVQTEMHDYANDVARLIITFNNSAGDQATLFDDYFADRTDPNEISRLQKLTEGYTKLAADLDALIPPEAFASIHERLVVGYTNVGTYLWDIRLANSDAELVERLLTYNVIAEDVARTHIVVVKTLAAYGVEFTPNEPAGKMFVFTGIGGSL